MLRAAITLIVHITNDRLPARLDSHVLNHDLLLPLASVFMEGSELTLVKSGPFSRIFQV